MGNKHLYILHTFISLSRSLSLLPMMRNKFNGIEQIHNCQQTNGMYSSLRNECEWVSVSVCVRVQNRGKVCASVCEERESENWLEIARTHNPTRSIKWRGRINLILVHLNSDLRSEVSKHLLKWLLFELLTTSLLVTTPIDQRCVLGNLTSPIWLGWFAFWPKPTSGYDRAAQK